MVAVAVAVWGVVVGGTTGWTVVVVAVVLAAGALVLKYLLAGRYLKRRGVPNRSLVVGAVLGIVGFFVIPVIGLFIGFAAGLFGSQWARTKDARAALASSWGALKAMGLGMLVELGCAMLALASVGIGVVVHFLSA